MIYLVIFLLSIWNGKTAAQHSYQIDDIPIEHYVHEDIQQDEIDVELMPKSSRLLPANKNVAPDINYQKIHQNRNYNNDFNLKHEKSRTKRDTSSEIFINKIGKPLELLVIETENITEKNIVPTSSTPIEGKEDRQLEETFLINDFIRFKRSTTESGSNDKSERLAKSVKFVQRVPESSFIHAQKLTMDPNNQKDITRETRGATKEQWIGQTYPVQRNDDIYDDNIQMPSEPVRAPRVHFVTNGMADRDPLEYKFNREPRSGSTNKYSTSDLSAEMDYNQPRFARNFVPRGRYTGTAYDRYPSDRRDYYRGQNYPDKSLDYSLDNNGGYRKRRIIYYATLPEVPRNSRDDDVRRPYDRYYYRDRYDDRYLSPQPYESYRKRYFEPARYYDDRDDSLFPVKVSTDVNVRAVKKVLKEEFIRM